MGRREIFLLLLLSSASFALIDPPVNDVYQHNVAAASNLNGILNQNLLDCTERTPDIDDPTSFFCVKALTLTPSVNYTVTSALHPKLIWAIAEDNGQTFRTNWTTDPDCSESWRQRTYGAAALDNATAYFTVDGLLDEEGGNYTYKTANDSEDLLSLNPLTNVSTQLSIIDVPFKDPLISPCSIFNLVSQFILGGFFNLNCYEPALDRASPYAAGVYNLTVRNQTIVTPHLNVTIDAEIEIPYTETGEDCYKGKKGCTCDSVSDDSNATFWASDFASYEVQNSYMTFVPYMPAFLNYTANTSQDATFHFSLFSNSELYKYYFVMDNQTATAYYLYDFVVQNDSTGIETILAVPNGTIGAMPGDLEALKNYTGSHVFFLNISGNVLREPYEMNNLSYNYSKVYDLMEMFFNLSSGPHHADLEFFTFFGNQTLPYNISVRARTNLMIGAGAGSANNTIDVNCLLTSRGLPAPGQEVVLIVGNQTQIAVTDSQGMCPVETFQAADSIGTAYGEFEGTQELLPSTNRADYALGSPFSFGTDLIGDNFALLLLLSVLLAFSVMELLGFLAMGPVAGGMTMGMVMDKFYPYKPDVGKAIAKGINSYTKQVGKVVVKGAVAIAAAVATVVTGGVAAAAGGAAAAGTGAAAGASGAAGGGAAGSAAAQAAAKEAAKKAAMDSLKDRAMKEMSENAGKKVVKKGIGKTIKKEMEKKAKEKLTKKKKGAFAAAGDREPGDGKGDKAKNAKEKAQAKLDPAGYLDTPPERIQQRDQNRPKLVDNPREAMIDEMAKIVEKKDGSEASSLFRKEHHDTVISFEIPSEKKWDIYSATRNENALDLDGVTINKTYIRISPYTIDKSAIDALLTGVHEANHSVGRIGYENRPICDGFVEDRAGKYVQNCESIPKAVKENIEDHLTYGEYRKISQLTEEIVTTDEYVYAHAKGGEKYLRTKFDDVVNKVGGDRGTFNKIFHSGMELDDMISNLEIIQEKIKQKGGAL